MLHKLAFHFLGYAGISFHHAYCCVTDFNHAFDASTERATLFTSKILCLASINAHGG